MYTRRVSPVLVASCPHVLHGGEATRNASEAVQVFQNSASYLQVIRVPGGLEELQHQQAASSESTDITHAQAEK